MQRAGASTCPPLLPANVAAVNDGADAVNPSGSVALWRGLNTAGLRCIVVERGRSTLDAPTHEVPAQTGTTPRTGTFTVPGMAGNDSRPVELWTAHPEASYSDCAADRGSIRTSTSCAEIRAGGAAAELWHPRAARAQQTRGATVRGGGIRSDILEARVRWRAAPAVVVSRRSVTRSRPLSTPPTTSDAINFVNGVLVLGPCAWNGANNELK